MWWQLAPLAQAHPALHTCTSTPPLQTDWLGKTTVDVGTARAQERGRLQSASLSLGAMHARLGHIEEAMQALNETVGGWVGGGCRVGVGWGQGQGGGSLE